MAEGGQESDGLREVVHGVEDLRVVDLDEKWSAAVRDWNEKIAEKWGSSSVTDWNEKMEVKEEDLNCVQLHKKAYNKKVAQLYMLYVDLFGVWRVEMFGKVMEERDGLLEWLKNGRQKVLYQRC